MRPVGLGDHQEAARILVEAVHDPRPHHPADAGKARAAMRNEGIDQGSGLVPRRGMDDQAGRLVDDDEVVVLVDDVEGDRFRPRLGRHRRRHRHDDLLAGTDDPARLGDRHPVDGHRAVDDQGFRARPAEFRQRHRQ